MFRAIKALFSVVPKVAGGVAEMFGASAKTVKGVKTVTDVATKGTAAYVVVADKSGAIDDYKAVRAENPNISTGEALGESLSRTGGRVADKAAKFTDDVTEGAFGFTLFGTGDGKEGSIAGSNNPRVTGNQDAAVDLGKYFTDAQLKSIEKFEEAGFRLTLKRNADNSPDLANGNLQFVMVHHESGEVATLEGKSKTGKSFIDEARAAKKELVTFTSTLPASSDVPADIKAREYVKDELSTAPMTKAEIEEEKRKQAAAKDKEKGDDQEKSFFERAKDWMKDTLGIGDGDGPEWGKLGLLGAVGALAFGIFGKGGKGGLGGMLGGLGGLLKKLIVPVVLIGGALLLFKGKKHHNENGVSGQSISDDLSAGWDKLNGKEPATTQHLAERANLTPEQRQAQLVKDIAEYRDGQIKLLDQSLADGVIKEANHTAAVENVKTIAHQMSVAGMNHESMRIFSEFAKKHPQEANFVAKSLGNEGLKEVTPEMLQKEFDAALDRAGKQSQRTEASQEKAQDKQAKVNPKGAVRDVKKGQQQQERQEQQEERQERRMDRLEGEAEEIQQQIDALEADPDNYKKSGKMKRGAANELEELEAKLEKMNEKIDKKGGKLSSADVGISSDAGAVPGNAFAGVTVSNVDINGLPGNSTPGDKSTNFAANIANEQVVRVGGSMAANPEAAVRIQKGHVDPALTPEQAMANLTTSQLKGEELRKKFREKNGEKGEKDFMQQQKEMMQEQTVVHT